MGVNVYTKKFDFSYLGKYVLKMRLYSWDLDCMIPKWTVLPCTNFSREACLCCPGRVCPKADCAALDVYVLQQAVLLLKRSCQNQSMLSLDVTVLPRSMHRCKWVFYIRLCYPCYPVLCKCLLQRACAVPRSVCSTAACAALVRVCSTAVCTEPEPDCSRGACASLDYKE